MAPLPTIVWFLSPCPSWHAPSSSISALPVWVVCHPSRTLPPKEPWQEPQNLPSLHHQTIPSYLWPMTSLHPVLAGYRLVRSGPYACLPSICVQNLHAAHSSAMVWRLACTIYRPFFDLLCHLLFDFPLPLGAGPLLLLGFTFLLAHFLIALISCHVTLSFLL